MISWQAVNNFGDTTGGGLAGPTGLVLILVLVIGTVLLIRNMNSRLRRLPKTFEAQRAPGQRSGRDATGAPTSADSAVTDVTTED